MTYEYCVLEVYLEYVKGAAAKERGWKREGVILVAKVIGETATGDLRVLLGREGEEGMYLIADSLAAKQACLGVLNELGAKGWRVVQYTPHRPEHDSGFLGDYGAKFYCAWPTGDFLLERPKS